MDYSIDAGILKLLNDAGYVIIPKIPSEGLLVSMAMRWDHSFGFNQSYTPHERRSLMRSMGQIYQEVSGQGFYNPEKENRYVNIIDNGGNP